MASSPISLMPMLLWKAMDSRFAGFVMALIPEECFFDSLIPF
jgi:hypothetical protein